MAKKSRRRRRVQLTAIRGRRLGPPSDIVFDYKDPGTLKRFIAEDGKIVPRRVSRLSAKMQRKLAREVKRARYLALMPFTTHERKVL